MKNMKTPCETCQSREKSIFCELTQNELADISNHKITNLYKKSQTLFHEGNPPFGLFCINEGKIKLSKTSSDGKESIVRIVGPGDVLGHRTLFSEGPYQATATALEDCKVCFIDKKYFLELIKAKPQIANEVIAHLSKEMGAVEERIAHFYTKNVRERLAEVLIEFKEKYGIEEDGKIRLDIKLTREEMASFIGVATETLIRFMTEFKDEGAIEQEGKTIFITDLEKLAELGNLQA
jgi:CRP-like cAMP-binding protein